MLSICPRSNSLVNSISYALRTNQDVSHFLRSDHCTLGSVTCRSSYWLSRFQFCFCATSSAVITFQFKDGYQIMSLRLSKCLPSYQKLNPTILSWSPGLGSCLLSDLSSCSPSLLQWTQPRPWPHLLACQVVTRRHHPMFWRFPASTQRYSMA